MAPFLNLRTMFDAVRPMLSRARYGFPALIVTFLLITVLLGLVARMGSGSIVSSGRSGGRLDHAHSEEEDHHKPAFFCRPYTFAQESRAKEEHDLSPQTTGNLVPFCCEGAMDQELRLGVGCERAGHGLWVNSAGVEMYNCWSFRKPACCADLVRTLSVRIRADKHPY